MPETQVQTKELAISEGYLTKAQREYYDYINQSILGIDEKSPVEIEESASVGEKIDVIQNDEFSRNNVRKTIKRTTERENIESKGSKESKDDKGEISQ